MDILVKECHRTERFVDVDTCTVSLSVCYKTFLTHPFECLAVPESLSDHSLACPKGLPNPVAADAQKVGSREPRQVKSTTVQ